MRYAPRNTKHVGVDNHTNLPLKPKTPGDVAGGLFWMAGGQGFEPRLSVPETPVLPIIRSPKNKVGV